MEQPPVEEHDEDLGTDWGALAREEVLWILQTLAMVILSLAAGRILTLLTRAGGVDLNLMSGDWQKAVDNALVEQEDSRGNH